MNTNTKKYILTGVVVTTLLIGASSLVFAQDSLDQPSTITPPPTTVPPPSMPTVPEDGKMVLQIGPEGRVLLRGTVSAVGTNSLTVKSWGGDWTVNVPTTAQVLPQTTTLSQVVVGEFVGVQGVVSQTAPWTIDAKLMRNWTERKVMMENKQMMKTENHDNGQKPEGLKNLGGQGSQGVQAQIQSILEQIKKIQAQISAQQTLPTPSTTPPTQ